MIPTFAREKARISRADKAYYSLAVFALLLTVLMYAYPSIQGMQLVYEKQRIETKKRELKVEQNRLRLEYEMLMSPDEMEERAKSHGYTEPVPGQVIYIKKRR